MAQQRDMYNQYIPPNGYQPNPAYAQQQQSPQQQQPDAMSSPQQQQQIHRNYAPNPAYRPAAAFGQGMPPSSSAAAYQQHIQMQQQMQQMGYAAQQQQPQNMQFHQMNMPPQGYPPNVAFQQQSMHRPQMHSQQMAPQIQQQMHQMQQQRPVYQGNMVYGMPQQNMMQQQQQMARPMHQMQQQQQHRYGPPQQGQQNMMTWKMMSQGQMHQAQHHPQHSAPAPAPQKTRQSSRKTKKRIVYDEASSDEEEELDLPSEESEDEVSDFDDSDSPRSKKNKKAKKDPSAAVSEESEDLVTIPMGTKEFEKILDYRKNPITNKEELLVKYKNMSYHHIEWLPITTVESAHLGKHRVKKFLSKYQADGEKGEDYAEYLKIDRIIDEGELNDPETDELKVYYLVKWNNTFYDGSTWESEDDVEKIDEAKIDEFHTRRQMPDQKRANYPARPYINQYFKYDRSPRFKYSNELRSYQLEGLNWLRFCYYSFRSCILADEMGLGKTVQSVALLNDIYCGLNIRGPFLVVAPLSTIPHWERAFKAWTDLNTVDYRGSQLARALVHDTEFFYKDADGQVIPSKTKFDVLITTYEMASAGAAHLREINWQCAVFDEAHRLKNKQSKVLEILKTFTIYHKLLLTGTPLQNNLDELFSLLHFMQPEIYSDERLFFHEYGSLQTAAQVEKLQLMLKPIMLRRFKEDVEKSIPVKEETVIEVELTNPQKRYYRAILERNFGFLKKGSRTNKELPHLRNIMMQLRKCCIHPYLLEGAEEVITSESNAKSQEAQFKCLIESSGKLVLIDKLLKKLKDGNHKVLIFSQFTTCLDILADYLRGRNYNYERIDGGVPSEQRQAGIDRFSTMPIDESFVFLLCTRAGGVGINLTAADTVIIFDSDWNPQNDLQAQARCHRIGQTKPVQIYRLVCRNTYEKDMFDRAGLKLGLDKAVMRRMESQSSSVNEDETGISKNELNKKEIEDLLKKGAYGAMMDDESSAQFCAEDIDQILERRTTVIRHEGNDTGSMFSKATFSSSDGATVELDDPDFWEKWAAKAQIETTEAPDENELIVYQPRRRRQVQRFGSRPADGSVSSNEGENDSDAYVDDKERGRRKRDGIRPWSLSEKTKYERKLMIYGYGRWKSMKTHFPRRSERDLKAVTRAMMRLILPTIERNTEEDYRLIQDIEGILDQDVDDEPRNKSVPYNNATKAQTAEYRTFLLEAPQDYLDHVTKKGRNIILRIQMLHVIRDKIVPQEWDEAKKLEIPKVTGNPPAAWWGHNEDRDLLLGICRYGYQQYYAMRSDPEFSFYGRKYDDSQAGLDDEDGKQESDAENEKNGDTDANGEAYIWPSKADLGMRLRRIIAAFLREKAIVNRKESRMQKHMEKEKAKEAARERTKLARQRKKEDRLAEKQEAKWRETSKRWSKKSKQDFLRTVMSFGVETIPGDPNILWDRFKELSGLDKKTDESLDLHLQDVISICEDVVKRHNENTNGNGTAAGSAGGKGADSSFIEGHSRDSSMDPIPMPLPPVSESGETDGDEKNETSDVKQEDEALDNDASNTDIKDEPLKTESVTKNEDDADMGLDQDLEDDKLDDDKNDDDQDGDQDGEGEGEGHDGDAIPYDRARRVLKRIEQMKTIRESVMVNPDLDDLLSRARKTSGLPSWWKVPEHDKAFLQGICKHGVNRSDLIVADDELPFHHIKKQIESTHEASEAKNEEGEEGATDSEFLWPRDLVIARRIDSLCELVLKPKPLSKRGATSRKRKAADAKDSKPSGLKLMLKVNKHKQQDYASDEEDESMATYSSDEGEDTDDMLEQANQRLNSRSQASSVYSQASPNAANHPPDVNEEMPSKKPRLDEATVDAP